jgi:hypothetical protein
MVLYVVITGHQMGYDLLSEDRAFEIGKFIGKQQTKLEREALQSG